MANKYPVDLTGIVFDKLTALHIDPDNPKKWVCKCECNNTKSIARNNLVTGHTKSCGCVSRKYPDDISGDKYNKLSVIKRDETNLSNFICECDCGNIVSVDKIKIITGHTQSCGCLNDKSQEMIGLKFGKLTVIDIAEESKRGYRQCICDCDCGNKNILVVSAELRHGKTKSCGCTFEEIYKKGREQIEQGAIDGTNVYKLNNKVAKNNKSGHTGVVWHKQKQRWLAIITYKKKIYYLGYYRDIDDAIAARKAAEQVTHEVFLEWYEKYKTDLDNAPPSPDGSELEILIKKR